MPHLTALPPAHAQETKNPWVNPESFPESPRLIPESVFSGSQSPSYAESSTEWTLRGAPGGLGTGDPSSWGWPNSTSPPRDSVWTQPQQVALLGGQAWLWFEQHLTHSRGVTSRPRWELGTVQAALCPAVLTDLTPSWSFTANAMQGLLLLALSGKANILSQILPKGSPHSCSLGSLSSLLALLLLVCFADGPAWHPWLLSPCYHSAPLGPGGEAAGGS